MKIDKSLIESCINKERAGQNQLYKELFSYLMNICMRYKNDYDTAGGSLNAIYLKVLDNLEKFRKEDSFIAWVKRIAINHLIDEYRKEQRIKKNTSYIEDRGGTIEATEYHSMEAEMESEYLLEMIKGLPAMTQQVFNLYAIDGYKHREIAELLNMSENTSKWHLREARIKLQAKLLVYNENIS
jgi:RNA polymerase sigma-70 factor (ECF subfamily)